MYITPAVREVGNCIPLSYNLSFMAVYEIYFHQIGPLGRFGLVVAMSVYMFIYIYGQESAGWKSLFKLVTFFLKIS